MIRIPVEAAAGHLEESRENAQKMLNTLVEKGYLESETRWGVLVYTVHYGRTNPRDVPGSLWAALGEKVDE